MSDHTFEEYRVEMLFEDPTVGGCCGWIAEIPDVLSDGADPTECVQGLRDGFALWTAEMRSQGRPVPDPWGADEASGRFLLRMPTALHARATREARRQGVSLNQYLNVVIAERLGFAEGVRSVTAGGASLACEEPPGSQP